MSQDRPLSFLKSWEGFLPPNTVLMARRSLASAEAPAYRIAFEVPGIETPALRDLFLKIVSAIGIAEDDYHASENAYEVQAETVIRFTASESEAPGATGWKENTLSTYSLAAMIAKPDLKKTVWAQLKPVFGASERR